MKLLKSLPLAAFVSLLASPAALLAATTDSPPPATEVAASPGASTVMEPIIVTGGAAPYIAGDSSAATGLDLSARDTPQSVTVITRERMEDQNLQSLRDVLDNTPGVYSYAYDSERVVFTSRGFTIDSVLYDGVPATSNYNTGSADETLDTALYERIEIVRGATGLMTGAGSPSASVNLVRKHADSRSFAASTDLTLGSWNDYRAVVDLSVPLTANGNVRARMVGVYQDRESYQDLYANGKTVFYGVIDADLSKDTTATFGYDYQDTRADSNTWGSFPLYLSNGELANWNRGVTTATDWSFWDKRKQTAFVALHHNFANGWSLGSTLSRRTLKEDLDLFYVYGFPDPVDGSGLEPYEYRANGDVKQTSLDVHASGPFEFMGREHELLLGYNGSRVDTGAELFEAVGELPPIDNFFEWDGSYPQPTHLPGVNIADIEDTQHGLYAAARLTLTDTLKFIGGARYSVYERDLFDIYVGPPFKYDNGEVTPYAGLIYDFSADWSMFTSYTSIFNPQNARFADGGYLDPIEGKSLEVGIKGEHFEGRLNTALTLFDTRQDNVAAADYDAETGEPIYVVGTNNQLQASRAIDGTHSRGFEVEMSGSPLKSLNVSLGWSRYLLEDADGHAIRTWTPRTLIKSFLSWTPQGVLSQLTVGGGVNWQSRSTAAVETPSGFGSLQQASVTLVGLMARWQFTPTLSVQLNGDNLLDRKYYVLDEYSNLYYGEPASAAASISYRF
ncbi:MAG TPA: TonB-dependent siderophore receptor [Fontimonas sp.]